MEKALAQQSAAFDNAAEQSAKRMQVLTGAGATSAGLIAAGAETSASHPQILAVEETPGIGAGVISNDAFVDNKVSAVDLSLEPDSSVAQARHDLLAAQEAATWDKLSPEVTIGASTPTPKKKAPLEEMREDFAAIRAPRESVVDTIDPFDDLGPSAPKPMAGAALGAGVAMGFGATRGETDPSETSVKVGSPILEEPTPVPSEPREPVPTPPKESELEFMQRTLDWTKFVKAANFPENERDTETLDALYDVLTDPEAAALLQSSEDTLATLADLDLYMEDFVPEMSPVTTWREHLEGKSGVQGIVAEIEQSRINAKMNADGAFRKLSERFVERYKALLQRLFNEGADDRLALELADSRTGRAYILVADALGKL